MGLITSSNSNNTNGLIVSNANTQAKPERKPTELYLNIGVNREVTNPDGTVSTIFVSIPYGVDLTNMPDRKVSGKDTDYNKLMNASNQLLEMIREKGLSLKDGESCEVNLVCRLQKVNATPSTNNGGLLDGLVL